MFGRNANRGNNACGGAGVNARKLYVFHYGRNKGGNAVRNRVRLSFNSVDKETVNQNRPFGRNVDSSVHVLDQLLFVVNDLHCASS